MQHKIFGGSTAQRLIICPGWLKASEHIPKSPSSIYAERGTELHNIQEGLRFSADLPESLDLSDDYATATRIAYDQTDDLLEKYETFDLTMEQFALADLPDCGGSLDLLAENDDTAVFIDYKFGNGIVPATNNKQLLFYAWIMRHNNPDLKLKKTIVAIVQPVQGKADIWEVSEKALEDFDVEYRNAVALALTDNPPKKASGSCQFCPARPYCDTQKSYAARALTLDPKDRESLEDALSMAKQLESWCKTVFAEGQRILEGGEQLQDWKLVQKRAVRKWISESDVDKIVKHLDDFYTTKLISPTQAEKPEVPDKIRGKLDALVIKQSSGLTIVSSDDKRLGVSTAIPEALFALK